MSYSSTSSTTYSWSRVHARQVAGKVAADLRRLSQAYGRPSESEIQDFLEELTALLAEGYLERMTYGFQGGGVWVVALRYVAGNLGEIYEDERSGGVDTSKDVTNASWRSFFVGSAKWNSLTLAQQEAFCSTLPIQRVVGVEPGSGFGSWTQDRRYAAGGGSMARSVLN